MRAEYIDHMGNDLSVVNAARVSFGKTKADMDKADERLIAYLAKHNHWTPFTHTAITVRMGAPLPIRTQCFKHKQGLTENEESRRYISDEPEIYVPDEFRAKPQGSIKQGSAGVHPLSDEFRDEYTDHCRAGIEIYLRRIEQGFCPEQTRFILPQGAMVNWIWTGNLASFARFYSQRTGEGSQVETDSLARKVGEIIQPLFPISWAALTGTKA